MIPRLKLKGHRYAIPIAVLSLLLSVDYFEWSDEVWNDLIPINSPTQFKSIVGTAKQSDANNRRHQPLQQKGGLLKFYILPMPEITTWLLRNFTEVAADYYQKALNEEQAEVWLHRGLELLSNRTENPSEADVVIIPGYLHLNQNILRLTRVHANVGCVPFATDDWLALLKERLVPNKVHVLAIPTWNPTRANEIGLTKIQKLLEARQIRLASFGFERNNFWQKTEPEHIIPIPYVVTPNRPRDELEKIVTLHNRTENFVFYAGDARKHALQWAGCSRSTMVIPLQDRADMYVRIVTASNRLTQQDYALRMMTSDFCLILCGDTPSSRSLASSMLHGCIPVRVGSRLRGFCEPPCHAGWGWSITNLSHLPFEDAINWSSFPEVDEAAFSQDPVGTLSQMFQRTDSSRKDSIRSTMKRVEMAWVYGWGSPVNSTDFGEAVLYAWSALVKYILDSSYQSAVFDS